MTEQTIQEINVRAAARRYAEMMTIAAGAEEKIAELTKAVEESEWLRNLAEQQLYVAEWPEGVGKVYHVGTEEPEADVEAIIDLYDGQVYVRDQPGGYWKYADKHGATMQHEWPIGNDSGPFIKLKSDWKIGWLFRELKAADERHTKIRNALSNKPGYGGEDEDRWSKDSADGAIAAYAEAETKIADLHSEIESLKFRSRALELDNKEAHAEVRRLRGELKYLTTGEEEEEA